MNTRTDAGAWGPLSEPVHGPVPDDSPPWRDNAFINFWDEQHDVYGMFHVSTSPNSEGRRARISVHHAGRTVEVVEPLEPRTFCSASITFDLDSTVSVASPELSGTLHAAPHFGIADYSKSAILPIMVEGQPLRHYQSAARVRGTLTLNGREVTVDGHGFRDRTWGYRDESANWSEYVAAILVFDSFALSSMRFRRPDGSDFTDGFRMTDGVLPVSRMGITRDASGLFAAADITFDDGSVLDVRSVNRRAGFWVPMGWERKGPTMSCYDEFIQVRTEDGDMGFGMIEQGIVRQIF